MHSVPQYCVLGYVTALLDLILSPATPSNTARAAGIVYPINLSIAESIGSYPGDTAKTRQVPIILHEWLLRNKDYILHVLNSYGS